MALGELPNAPAGGRAERAFWCAFRRLETVYATRVPAIPNRIQIGSFRGTGPGPQQLNVKSVEVGGRPAKHVRLLGR